MGEQKGNDWAAFYEDAWEKAKRQNNMLAVRLAEAEARQEDLQFQWNRLNSNPMWKLTAPFRKVYHWKDLKLQRSRKEEPALVDEALLTAYEKEVKRQQESYLQWIKNNSRNSMSERNTGEAIKIGKTQEIWEVDIPETELVLYGYGMGCLDAQTFEEVKLYFNKNQFCLMAGMDEDFYWKNIENRMLPWFKPGYSPDTLLAFNCFGHVVAVRRELAERAGVRRICEQGKAAGESPEQMFYDICLHLEESTRWDSLHEIPGVFSPEKKIGQIQKVLFHCEYVLPEDKSRECEKLQAGWFAYAKSCLEKELEAGRYLTGAGAEFTQIREDAFARRGIRAFLRTGQDPDIYHVVYDTAISGRERCNRALNSQNAEDIRFLVSVVIPTKDHPEILETCLRSFIEKTNYEDYEFVIVDNGSKEENRLFMEKVLPVKLRELWEKQGREKDFRYTYLYEMMPFNFSKMCNKGAVHAKGDLLLFLNDDMEIIEENWLGRMVGQAIQKHTGAVGARLWYAGTKSIQHAGITNLEIGPSHKLVTFADDRDYYYGHNRVTYDMAGVTGACLLVGREKFQKAGGLDESMAVSYNDVDMCFRLLECGYYNVLRNDAVLYHHESLSRGLDEENEEKWERLLKEKDRLYQKHPLLDGFDPFYSDNLIDNASDYRCNYKFPYEEQLNTTTPAKVEAKTLRKAKEGKVRLTVDRAEQQHKIHASEPDIIWIMGWSYVPGADNAAYERTLVLQREDGLTYEAEVFPWHRVDVEKILPQERHIGLAGFVTRIRKADLESGTYRIGVLCTRQAGKKRCMDIAWGDKQIDIESL